MLKDNINQKLFFNFTDKYYQLYEDGKISEDQLNTVLTLLDNYQEYKPEEFKTKLKDIFRE
jgi:predicted type IV restriction endonuclease